MGEFGHRVVGEGCSLIPKLADWNAFLKDKKYFFYYQRISEKGKKKLKLSFSLKNCVLFRVWEKGTCSEAGVGGCFFYYYYFLLSRKHWQLDCSDQ